MKYALRWIVWSFALLGLLLLPSDSTRGGGKTTRPDPKTTPKDRKTTPVNRKTTKKDRKTTRGNRKTARKNRKTNRADRKSRRRDSKSKKDDKKTDFDTWLAGAGEFNNIDWYTRWTWLKADNVTAQTLNEEPTDLTREKDTGPKDEAGNHLLQVAIPDGFKRPRKSDTGSQYPSQNYLFKDKGLSDVDELYFRYWVRLDANWTCSEDPWDGRMPRFSATDGDWTISNPCSRPLAGNGVLLASRYNGELWPWAAPDGFHLQTETWYCIVQRVKMNDPGKANGIFEAWVYSKAGAQLAHLLKNDLALRPPTDTERKTKIAGIWMRFYYSSAARVAQDDMSLFVDKVILSRVKNKAGP